METCLGLMALKDEEGIAKWLPLLKDFQEQLFIFLNSCRSEEEFPRRFCYLQQTHSFLKGKAYQSSFNRYQGSLSTEEFLFTRIICDFCFDHSFPSESFSR